MTESGQEQDALAALRWLVDAGADEALADMPQDRYAQAVLPATAQPAAPQQAPPAPDRRSPPPDLSSDAPGTWAPKIKPPSAPQAVIEDARAQANAAQDLESLHTAIRAFEGCALKQSATNTVIFRGNPAARVMLIGEAPGRDEDLQGEPFVGAAGRLLDDMLRWAGFGLDEVFITNVLFWRPPGNRTPEQREIAVCLPFIERQIALLQPRHLLLIGNVATKSLLVRSEGITRLRGRWFPYEQEGLSSPLPAMASLHPAYLLRQPAQKRLAWRDMLDFRAAVAGNLDPLAGSAHST
ncbi:uracil-DNA glycosylase [Aquibaculum sediminis]|uniref:uracil-DNA glycosylase n=1 Tax=Aquibaculum sediminis TaxID=3231907 RepID=UPI00345207C4